MGVTIKDIAKESGVSITTVSRVLNDKPDVSSKTKEKVKEVIDRLGYKPSGVARGLVLQKTYTIGLIIPDISNPFFPEVARGIEDKAKEMDYSVIFCNTDNDHLAEKEAIKLMKSKQVDGILLSLSIENKEELKKLEEDDFPVVQIDRKVPNSELPSVTIDNVLSAYNATEHLIQLGHTQIVHITGDLGTKTAQDRLKGFKKAINGSEISYKEEWILEGDYSKESGYNLMKSLLKEPPQPTAIFAANDLMAIGAYGAAYDLGLEIPEDISIVGHDDIDIASVIRPGLTTMVQPKYELGKKAAEILIDELERKNIDKKDEILQPKLIERDSTRECSDNV
ncbi:transcriptional regulator, LacI family [Selenihalanaerobacter shriftii]|uniref:Transcriptional regulator, LacI family n=1 Tax=Selenihalanaerobacter shriftii TaxID=142842 RepID=A0A1T4JRL7_9FIRM|nr:transcriptional regulator, LacI family [Selenihalanaerobacter shriftii]